MKNTIATLKEQKKNGVKISMLTAYDYSTAKLMDEAAKSGVDAVKLIVSGKIDEAMNRFN